MSKLQIAANVKLPLDAVTQSIAILAKRRAGKSYLARRFAEQLLAADQQIVILDPKGDWWGIRGSADGKNPGFPVVALGGEHGDLPLEKTAAETVARLIVEERVSVLLDFSTFRKSEVAFFLGGDVKQRHDGLLELIYRLKAKEEFRTPLMMIVDEADAVAPQKPYPGEERMLGAIEDIVRRGGQRGLGSMLISQRSAVVNKNVLTQTQVMIAMRTIAEQDMDAIMAWVKVHGNPEQEKVLKASLPALPIGDAWILSPGWPTDDGLFTRIHVDPIATFDSGATPKPGEKRIKPKHLADVDLKALERRMAETIERAKATDPRELQKQLSLAQKKIQELERSGYNKKVISGAKVEGGKLSGEDRRKEYERGFQAGVEKGERIQIQSWMARQAELKKKLNEIGRETKKLTDAVGAELLRTTEHLDFATQKHNKLVAIAGQSAEAWNEIAQFKPAKALAASAETETVLPEPRHFDRVAKVAKVAKMAPDGRKIAPAEQRILDAIAEFEALGIKNPARVQVAFMAGYTNLTSKGFVNAIGALRSAGQIDYPSSGAITLTGSGREAANYVENPTTTKELQKRLMEMLGGANERILQVLVEAWPESVPRDELGAKAGYTNLTSKGFTNAIGRLRTLGLIDYPERGRVAAQSVLFLEER
jgi:hypothetical protein